MDQTRYSNLGELNTALAEGTPWREGVSRLSAHPWTEFGSLSLEFPPLQNLCWLGGVTRVARALDIGSPFGSVAASLVNRFAKVTLLDFDRTRCQFARERFRQDHLDNVEIIEGSPTTLPVPDTSYDLVIISELQTVADLRARKEMIELFRKCRSVLRSDGCLFVGLRNPNWYERLRREPRVNLSLKAGFRIASSVDGLMRTAGLRDVRAYYCSPSVQHPREILPATRAAVRAHYSVAAGRGGVARFLMRLGCHWALYPSHLMFGRV